MVAVWLMMIAVVVVASLVLWLYTLGRCVCPIAVFVFCAPSLRLVVVGVECLRLHACPTYKWEGIGGSGVFCTCGFHLLSRTRAAWR